MSCGHDGCACGPHIDATATPLATLEAAHDNAGRCCGGPSGDAHTCRHHNHEKSEET